MKCPYCLNDTDEVRSEELKALIVKCQLISEHVNPGGRELLFKVGGRIQLSDQCNFCDNKELSDFLNKAISK